jgi:hypothetical protein
MRRRKRKTGSFHYQASGMASSLIGSKARDVPDARQIEKSQAITSLIPGGRMSCASFGSEITLPSIPYSVLYLLHPREGFARTSSALQAAIPFIPLPKRSSLPLKQFRQSLRLAAGKFIVGKPASDTPFAGLPFLQAPG